MRGTVRVLADFALQVRENPLPRDVERKASILLLNTVGVAISNREHHLVTGPASLSRGPGSAHLWGSNRELDEYTAAIANGIASHISDFDDTHPEGGLHPTGVLAPALIAIAEAENLPGRAVLRGFVVGQEIMARLAASVPHRFTLHGLHASSVCGVVASAAAVATARGAEPRVIAHAMAIAASQASGVIQTVLEGGDLKSFHLGWAAMGSIWAARLAAVGMTGPECALEGPQGLLGAFLGEDTLRHADLARLTRGLTTEWETLSVVAKPYPCCHFTHASIDAAREFRSSGETLEDVREIVCRVPREAEHVVCEPWEERRRPHSLYAAKFSLPFVLATALVHGRVTDEALSASLTDVRVHELIAKIRYEIDPDEALAKTYGAEVLIKRAGRADWSARIVFPTGSKERPVPDEMVLDKFRSLVAPALGSDRTEKLLEGLLGLDGLASTRDLFPA